MPGAHQTPVSTYSEREEWITTMLATPKIAHGAKSVGSALALHLNFQTGRLDPSARRLAKMTAQTEGNVNKHLRTLRLRGLIEWDSAKGRVSNKYRLTFPTLSQRMAFVGNPIILDRVGTRSNETGCPLNPIVADQATLSERSGQPYLAEQANLILNQESNLTTVELLERLRRAVGEEAWNSWVWQDARIIPPYIYFASPARLSRGLNHFGQVLHELGLTGKITKAGVAI